jgi:hypothetical protein
MEAAMITTEGGRLVSRSDIDKRLSLGMVGCIVIMMCEQTG